MSRRCSARVLLSAMSVISSETAFLRGELIGLVAIDFCASDGSTVHDAKLALKVAVSCKGG